MPAVEAPRPFEDLEQRGKHLKLPPYSQDVAKSAGPMTLARLPVPVADLELELRGTETVFDKGVEVGLVRGAGGSGPSFWSVLGRSETAVSRNPQPLGRFTVDAETLRFEWDRNAPSELHPDCLRFCVLRFQYKDERVDCLLSQPASIDPIVPNVKSRKFVWKFPKQSASFPPPQKLRVEVTLKGLPGRDAPEIQHLLTGEAATVSLSDSEKGETLLDIRLKFLDKDDSFSLQTEYLSQTGPFEATKHKTAIKEHPCSLVDVKNWLKAVKRKTASLGKQDSEDDAGAADPRRRFASKKRTSSGKLRPQIPSDSDNSNSDRSAMLSEASRTEVSLTKLQTLLEEIGQSTRIGLRVYVEIDGQAVDILSSRLE
jgi:hypothetical protein